jgi:hypothetical protein
VAPPLKYDDCRVAGCGQRKLIRHQMCPGCWGLVPEDLRLRLIWAREEGTVMDRRAAWRSAMESLGL